MKQCPYCAEEIHDAARVCKHCGRDLAGGASQVQLVQPKKKTGCVAMGCATLLGLFGAMVFLPSLFRVTTPPTLNPAASKARTPEPLSPEEQLAKDVKISGRWHKGGFGAVALWEITLKNTSTFTTWQDLRYSTAYFGESGKRLAKRGGELNIVLGPGKSRTLKDVNDGIIPQGATQANIELIGGVFDKLPTPSPFPTPKATGTARASPAR